ncbi:hypothetical protein, partial [Selenomonas ruminantium]
ERKKEQETARVEEEKKKAQELKRKKEQETARAEEEKKKAQELERRKEQEGRKKSLKDGETKSTSQDSFPMNFDSVLQYNYIEVPISHFANMPSTQTKIKKLCKNVQIKHDEMANKTYYSPKRVYVDPIALYPYIVVNHDTKIMQLIYHSVYMGSYSASSFRGITVQMGKARWINYHMIRIRADNKLYEMRYDQSRANRNIQTASPMIQGGIFGYSASVSAVESYDEVMDKNAFEVFQAIVAAKDVKMRFIGDNTYVDKKMKSKLKAIHEEVYAIFNLLMGKNN